MIGLKAVGAVFVPLHSQFGKRSLTEKIDAAIHYYYTLYSKHCTHVSVAVFARNRMPFLMGGQKCNCFRSCIIYVHSVLPLCVLQRSSFVVGLAGSRFSVARKSWPPAGFECCVSRVIISPLLDRSIAG